MINCKVDKGEVSASIHGDTVTLAAEVCCLIKSMYRSIEEDSKSCTKMFKKIITDEVNGDRLFDNSSNEIVIKADGERDDDDDDDDSPIKSLKELLENLKKVGEEFGKLDKKDED